MVIGSSDFAGWQSRIALSRFTVQHLFSSQSGVLRISYHVDESGWISLEPDVEDRWSPCLQTLEGHSKGIFSVVWSPDNNQVASGSDDCSVKIWNPITWQCMSTLQGYSTSIGVIAWSPDGTHLASSSTEFNQNLEHSCQTMHLNHMKQDRYWIILGQDQSFGWKE